MNLIKRQESYQLFSFQISNIMDFVILFQVKYYDF